MKKEKQVKSYQRRTKSGKVVTVKAHTAKYDAAEALKKAAKKEGAGEELDALKKKKPADEPDYGFTAEEYKAWYHWDPNEDPKNKTALKVEKALRKKMGTKAYNKYFNELTDSYSARGHNKAFKSLGDKFSMGDAKKDVKAAFNNAKGVGEKKPEKSTESKQSNDTTPQNSQLAKPGETLFRTLKIGRKSYNVKVDKITGEPLYNDGRSGWITRDEIEKSSLPPHAKFNSFFSDSSINKEPLDLFRNYQKAVKGGKEKEIKTARQHLQAAIDDAPRLTPEIKKIAINYDFSLDYDRPEMTRLKKKKSTAGANSKEHTSSKAVPAEGNPAIWAAEYQAYGESLQRKRKTPKTKKEKQVGVGTYDRRIKMAIEDWKNTPYGPQRQAAWDNIRYHVEQKRLKGFPLSEKEKYYLRDR